jgi:hypothetical protein
MRDEWLVGAPPQLLRGHRSLVFTALDGGPLDGFPPIETMRAI